MVFLIRIRDIKLGIAGRALLVADNICQVQRIGWLFRDLGWEIDRLATVAREREPWDGTHKLGIPFLTLTEDGWRLLSCRETTHYWTHHKFISAERISADKEWAKNKGN